MPGELPKSITYKYDLMHLNTPSFASSVVTWDTDKLTPITKKRVISALKEGYIKFAGGDAASMYGEIHRIMTSPEIQKKRDEAMNFVLAGGKLEFTYKV